MSLHGIDLTTFTPYSAKFAGHKIDKGKLNVDLHYLLSKRVLKGDNKVVLNQLELGEAVDSPDAVGLPVRLALAILKDANGVIDVDMPITGSLDEPDFHYGKLVWQALKNIIVKTATAPFRALASLIGGDENELNHIRFSLGDNQLAQGEKEKLSKLGQAMADRPALTLEIPTEEARNKLRQAMVVSDEELRSLAQARAEAGMDFLIKQSKLDPQRVFMLEVDTKASGDTFVDLPLTVQAR